MHFKPTTSFGGIVLNSDMSYPALDHQGALHTGEYTGNTPFPNYKNVILTLHFTLQDENI